MMGGRQYSAAAHRPGEQSGDVRSRLRPRRDPNQHRPIKAPIGRAGGFQESSEAWPRGGGLGAGPRAGPEKGGAPQPLAR